MSGSAIPAIRIVPNDNVATLLEAAAAGAQIDVQCPSDPAGRARLRAAEAIPAGHKIALADIPNGAAIRKYGTAIGYACTTITAGSLVHVLNTRSSLSPAQRSDARPEDGSTHPDAVPVARFRDTLKSCILASGIPARPAAALCDHIVEAHLRGVETHGLRRLRPYLERIGQGGVDADAVPSMDSQGALLAVDGRNGIGQFVASESVARLAGSARQFGAAVALIRNSNHFGFAGYYAVKLAAEGLFALVTSNGQPIMGPEGARRAILSNDPIAIAAPLDDDTFFEFDAAMSVTSRARIAQAAERGDEIAPGLGQDGDGNPTTDPRAALRGAVLPLGGLKGFAMTAAVELLTGVLSGGAYADLVASKEDAPAAPEGACHFMLAIDLSAAPEGADFVARARDLMHRLETLEMRAGSEPFRTPGKRRWEMRKQRLEAGIPLDPSDRREFEALQESLVRGEVREAGNAHG